jgi:hypothetical protein
MSEKVNIVKVNNYGNVTETRIMEIPDGINVNPGDTITEKGRCIIVERKNYMCDIYLKNKYDDTVTEVLKDFELNHNPSWNNQRIEYYSNKVAFLNSKDWDNKLINLWNGKVIAEETEECHFYGVKAEVSPIQGFGDSLYILNYSLAIPNEIYGADQYVLIDEYGNRVLPSKFVGRHKKIKNASGIGNILLLHYIDTSKEKYGMISVQIVGGDYIVKQIIERRYDTELDVNYRAFVKDVNGNIHYPCITGTYEDESERDITHYYNVLGQRITVK